MAEKKGYSLDDFNALEERKQLGGVSWASWKHNVIDFLQDNDLPADALKPEDKEILHKWFVLRREVQLRLKEGSDIDDFLEDSDIRSLPDDSTVIKGMAFITNKFKRNKEQAQDLPVGAKVR